jgi:uncharacterized protein (DUF362 family)
MTRGGTKDLPPRAYTRREVLARIATTAAAAAGVAGAAAALVDREPAPARRAAEVKDHRVDRPVGAVGLAIARGKDPGVNVRRAVEAVGGMGAFVRRGERVLVKPNAGWNRVPDQAANTEPAVVAEVVRLVLEAGAAEVWVADAPVNAPDRCFARSGIAEAARRAGARVVVPAARDFRLARIGGVTLGEGEVLWPLLEADRVVNIPVVKQHGLTRATLGMKNWYGVLGGHRARLHQDIHQSVVDLAAMVRPTLTVLDGTRALLANGPSGGSLDDVKRLDTIAVSADPVALDAFGASLLDLGPSELPSLALAARAGLGVADWRSLKVDEIAT